MPDLLERLRSALEGRYAVERELGRGGMATVFLAEDLKHHRHVAIKVLHPDLAVSVGPERFLREIEIAASLDHPHILTLLDSGEADGLLYYVMPYVEGESLQSHLESEKQLPIEEAIEIAKEVADGLGYAHRNGVVHRDIKPANILLSEGHALIADFGVARAVVGEGRGLTSTGLAVGTPAYMSPEQAGGEEVDARSDLYALGCVLYEMLAGEPPLVGPTPQATAALRLTETARPLPVMRETIPADLDRVTQKLLAKSPADRYRSAERVIEALERPGLLAEARPRWRVGATATVFGAVAIAISAALWLLGRGSPGDPAIEPQRIAVLPFENRTGDPSLDGLETSAAERITTRLQREDVGEVVPVGAVDAAMRSANAAEPVHAVATATGAAVVVLGAVTLADSVPEFAVRVMDAASGTQEGSFDVTATSARETDAALEEVASRLTGGLLLAYWGGEPESAFKAFPRVEAYWLFREGVALQLDGKLRESLDRLRAAAALDSAFALPVGYAIGSAMDLGMSETADSLTQMVRERFRTDMSEFERLSSDANRAFLDHDMAAAYRAQRRAVALDPDDWGAWQSMALYCFATNRPREAFEALREGESRLGDDPSMRAFHLFYLANAYYMLGDHEAELEVAKERERLAVRDPGWAKYFVGRAAAALGRVDDVGVVQDQLEALSDTSGSAAGYMAAIALELRYNGFRNHARAAMERALQWFEERPDWLESDSGHRRLYGAVLYYAERWTESEEVLRPLEESLPGRVHVLGYLGLQAARRGDVEEAKTYSDELERIGTADRDRRVQAWSFRARIAALLDRRVEAVQYLKQAFDEALLYWPGAPERYQYRFDFEAMSDYAPYQELLRPKG